MYIKKELTSGAFLLKTFFLIPIQEHKTFSILYGKNQLSINVSGAADKRYAVVKK